MSPYDAEWEAVERGKNKRLYWPLSHVESFVPWVFLFLHAIVVAKTFPWTPFLDVLLGHARRPF